MDEIMVCRRSIRSSRYFLSRMYLYFVTIFYCEDFDDINVRNDHYLFFDYGEIKQLTSVKKIGVLVVSCLPYLETGFFSLLLIKFYIYWLSLQNITAITCPTPNTKKIYQRHLQFPT